jgi:hypothetical protein
MTLSNSIKNKNAALSGKRNRNRCDRYGSKNVETQELEVGFELRQGEHITNQRKLAIGFKTIQFRYLRH